MPRLSPALILLAGTLALPGCAASPASDALITAAARGDTPAVQRLVADGADLDARDRSGRTALLAAVQGNHIAAARVLIDAGSDVNAKDALQDSPYLFAGASGHLDILRMTLSHGADLRSTNRYGGTALIPACERGHVDTVRTLIAAGVDVDHVNRLGWTCLLETVLLGDGSAPYVAITQQLIDARARLDLPDREGVTALQHARRMGQTAIVRLLADAGAH